jgi:hypothetical protein
MCEEGGDGKRKLNCEISLVIASSNYDSVTLIVVFTQFSVDDLRLCNYLFINHKVTTVQYTLNYYFIA